MSGSPRDRAVLLALFAAEGFTILSIHQLITLHFFLGMLLIGPVALKIGAVLYRFARYYSGAPEYRRKGPPAPLLRLLGPFVLVTSVGVIGTGVMLARRRIGRGAVALPAQGVLRALVRRDDHSCPRVRLAAAPAHRIGPARQGRSQPGRRVRWPAASCPAAPRAGCSCGLDRGGLLIAATTVHLASPWAGFHHSG